MKKTVEAWCDAYARSHGSTLNEVRSPSRTASLVRLRRAIAAYLRYALSWTYTRIGKFLCRTHATIYINLHGRAA